MLTRAVLPPLLLSRRLSLPVKLVYNQQICTLPRISDSKLAVTGTRGHAPAPVHSCELLQVELDRLWESDLNAGVVGQDPAAVFVRVQEAVTTLNWAVDSDRQAACLLIEQHAAGTGPGLTEPLLLKGAAAHWPALRKWSLDWLARTLPQLWVWVRVAASLRFTYVEPRLMPLWLRFFPAHRAPSMLTRMPLCEFAMRSQRACPLPPLFYPPPAASQQQAAASKGQLQHVTADARQLHTGVGSLAKAEAADAQVESTLPHDARTFDKEEAAGSSGSSGNANGEFYYMQSPLVGRLAQDCDLQAAPFSLVQGPDAGAPAMVASQNARLWASPQGAVSPLHFDSTTSFLTQVRGRKRLLFFGPEQLRSLGPYPSWHILRRRLRFDPAAPDCKQFPQARALGVAEAVLEPGDVLLFPPHWSHYTESLDWSLSVTWRFVHAGQRPKPYAHMRGMCFKWW